MSKAKQIQFSFIDDEPYGIEIHNLIKIYDDPASEEGIIGLRGVELSVEPSSMVSIIGPSGAGKSTLLNSIGGMITPTAGTIVVGDIPVHAIKGATLDYYRRMVVGFLWQLPERNLLPELSAAENIEFAHRVANYPADRRKERVNDLLKAVGLVERKDHQLGQLSGGEAQRVGLAVALANEPKVLCADEPTGELDSETTMEIIGYLQDINKEQGVTMVVVTHDTRFERMTKRSYSILDGQISGIRRSLTGKVSSDWKSAQREEVSFVDKFGNVRIPPDLREAANIGKYVKFALEKDRLYIEPADLEE